MNAAVDPASTPASRAMLAGCSAPADSWSTKRRAAMGKHSVAATAAKAKHAAVVGSFGWEGNLPEIVSGMLPKLGARFFEPVMVKGLPREAAFADLDRLADDIAAAHAAS